MSTPSVLITDMAILVGIFLLGFLAKMFPKRAESKETTKQETQTSTDR